MEKNRIQETTNGTVANGTVIKGKEENTMEKQTFRLKGVTVLASDYSEALQIKKSVKAFEENMKKCAKPVSYSLAGYQVIAESEEQAKQILSSVRDCIVTYETKRVSFDSLKVHETDKAESRYNRFTDNAYWDKLIERDRNTVQEQEAETSEYESINHGSLLNNIESASDWLNAYNQYIRELKETDSEAWKQETGLKADNDSVFGSYINYDFTMHYNVEIDVNRINYICSLSGIDYYNALCEYIADKDIYSHISKALVKHIASNPKADAMEACLQIVNKYYQDVIFDDIKQDIYIALHIMVHNDIITLDFKTGKLVFADYTTDSGNIRNYYCKLFSVVRNTFLSYKNVSFYQEKKKAIKEICLDDCKNVSDIYGFCESDKLNRLIEQDSFKSFIHYLSYKDRKNFKDMMKVLSALLKGKQLNNIKGMSKDRANYLKNSKLKTYHEKYFGKVNTRTVEYIKFNSKTKFVEIGNQETGKAYKPITVYIPKKDKKGNIKKGHYNYHYYKGHDFIKDNDINERFINHLQLKYKGKAIKKISMINYPVSCKDEIAFNRKVVFSTIKDRKTHTVYLPQKQERKHDPNRKVYIRIKNREVEKQLEAIQA